MLIKGFQKFTLLDYPGKIAAIIFFYGCNFKCGFCHNKGLVLQEESEKLKTYTEQEILEYLETNKDFIDGVVISGGEPTLQKELPEFLKKIKKLGYNIKLDTNGSNPELIEELVKKRLIDYVAMDIKTNLEEYYKITKNADSNRIKQSIEIIKNLPEYEFRTTVVPGLIKKENLLEIANLLRKMGANKKFVLQQFIPRNCVNPAFLEIEKTSPEKLEKLKNELARFFDKIEVRTE